VNSLFGLGLGVEELLVLAGKGEGAVSGSVHYDNVSAVVCGGFVVVHPWPRPSPIGTGEEDQVS
jgi:homoserine kinase